MHYEHHDVSWQQREHQRRSRHHKPRAVEGDIGDLTRTGAMLAPLIISEVVKAPEDRLRFIRIASVAAAILSAGLHAHKNYKDRERYRQALDACEMACPG